jgi:hypothetical protein
MVGEIISESWATSNRNAGRDHSGMVGDIERNQHRYQRVSWKAKQKPQKKCENALAVTPLLFLLEVQVL